MLVDLSERARARDTGERVLVAGKGGEQRGISIRLQAVRDLGQYRYFSFSLLGFCLNFRRRRVFAI